MRTARRFQKALRWSTLTAAAVAVSCMIPGVRPEGRITTVSAVAPAGPREVYLRAKEWFVRRSYTIVNDVAGQHLRGYSTIGTAGDIETRAVVDLTVTDSTGQSTNYRVTSHTEQGRPPDFARMSQNAPQAGEAVTSLVSYLSCPTARWPRCP